MSDGHKFVMFAPRNIPRRASLLDAVHPAFRSACSGFHLAGEDLDRIIRHCVVGKLASDVPLGPVEQ